MPDASDLIIGRGDLITQAVSDEFWLKVDKPGNCWEWLGARNKCGYGTVGINNKTFLAHRLIILMDGCDIPSGMCVLHRCDNPACVNPDHLFLGTHAENMADMNRKGRGVVKPFTLWGAENPSAKLTMEDVQDIRERASRGEPQKSIARVHGVCQATVSRTVTGKTWQSSPPEPSP